MKTNKIKDNTGAAIVNKGNMLTGEEKDFVLSFLYESLENEENQPGSFKNSEAIRIYTKVFLLIGKLTTSTEG